MEKFKATLLEAGKTDISRRMSPPNQQDYRGCLGLLTCRLSAITVTIQDP
jgi:hypothetical protein